MEEPVVGCELDNTQDNFSDVVNQVFDLELVREIVLDFAIHNRNDLLFQCIRSCRLVNKNWHQSVSRILLNSREPLFWLRLNSHNSSPGSAQGNGKLLDQFARSVNEQGVQLHGGRVPPHAIYAKHSFFRHPENYQSLYNCFVNYGNSLIQLKLDLLQHQKPLPLSRNVLLPKLQSLIVCLREAIPETYDNRKHQMNFIQSVFDASEQLQSFELKCPHYSDQAAPSSFSFSDLAFPPSITIMNLSCVLNDHGLEVLVRNPLPNLKTLKLYVSDAPYKGGLITSILECVRKTLQTFHVKQTSLMSRYTQTSTFRLPLMENLKILKINTAFLELEEEFSNLERFVPKLSHMTLSNQTVSMFGKWTLKSHFHSVTSLTVSLLENFSHNGVFSFPANPTISPDLNTMETLFLAFPNLVKLDITLLGIEVIAVQFIYREMKKLQHLRIFIPDWFEFAELHSWDALLIGVPERCVAALKESPDLWKDLQVGATLSIRNLTDLRTLALDTYQSTGLPIISDAAFHYGFLMMPNLQNLILSGWFTPTSEMIEKWKEEGRNFQTTSETDSDDD